MRLLLSIAACFLAWTLCAQVPQGIGYQGVATDAQGLELTNQSISIRASILSGGVNGEVQWQETHSTSTDDFGLFALTIGEGANTGEGQLPSFSDIPWGEDTYFLQIEMDASGSNDYVLMGVNQMMSVPYALYAENTSITYESIANFLLQDLNFIENITNVLSDSLANAIAVDSLFICNVVTNLSEGGCDSLLIDGPNDGVWACGDSIEYWDYSYATVQIGTACWFADNLKTSKYSDGTDITHAPSDNNWGNGYPNPLYAWNYFNGFDGEFGYGYLYNAPAALSTAGLCPSGWHVSTEEDWTTLESHLGMSDTDIASSGFRGTVEGFKLKYNSPWSISWLDGSNNESGFSAIQSGWRDGLPDTSGNTGYIYQTGARFWATTTNAVCTEWYHNTRARQLESGEGGIGIPSGTCSKGYSVRCVID